MNRLRAHDELESDDGIIHTWARIFAWRKATVPTLIIHAPKEKVDAEGHPSFARTLDSGVGEGYAISKADAARLGPGDAVVVLSKDERRRAEGRLEKLVPNGRTESGMQRYDVHIKDLKVVDYKPERLGRTGVSVV
jgi:hypothetical protein